LYASELRASKLKEFPPLLVLVKRATGTLSMTSDPVPIEFRR
jgi:hypothetical protein